MCYGLLVFALYCFKACIPHGLRTVEDQGVLATEWQKRDVATSKQVLVFRMLSTV